MGAKRLGTGDEQRPCCLMAHQAMGSTWVCTVRLGSMGCGPVSGGGALHLAQLQGLAALTSLQKSVQR